MIFLPFFTKNIEKSDFNQCLEWGAPKCWLKYTTQTCFSILRHSFQLAFLNDNWITILFLEFLSIHLASLSKTSLKLQVAFFKIFILRWLSAYNGELCTWFYKLEFCCLFFPFIEKLYPPVFSTVPAGWGIAISANVETR